MGYGWYLPEICALFLALAIAAGISAKYSADKIAAEKPRNYLALLTAFTELVRLEQAAHTATITSAVPLTEAEKAAITARLNTRQAGLNYEWQVDSSLIAGLTVKVGDNVTDASIRTRIEQLTKTL